MSAQQALTDLQQNRDISQNWCQNERHLIQCGCAIEKLRLKTLILMPDELNERKMTELPCLCLVCAA